MSNVCECVTVLVAGIILSPGGVSDEMVQNHAGKLAISWNGSPEEALTPSIRPDLFWFTNRNLTFYLIYLLYHYHSKGWQNITLSRTYSIILNYYILRPFITLTNLNQYLNNCKVILYNQHPLLYSTLNIISRIPVIYGSADICNAQARVKIQIHLHNWHLSQ